MKVGIIRCQQTEDLCPGTTDFKIAAAGKGVFAQFEQPIEIVAFVSCGGCPGKKVWPRVQTMLARGADAIALASCLGKGTPLDFSCPFFDQIEKVLQKRLPAEIKLLSWTHA